MERQSSERDEGQSRRHGTSDNESCASQLWCRRQEIEDRHGVVTYIGCCYVCSGILTIPKARADFKQVGVAIQRLGSSGVGVAYKARLGTLGEIWVRTPPATESHQSLFQLRRTVLTNTCLSWQGL